MTAVHINVSELHNSDAWVLCPAQSRPWLLMALVVSCGQAPRASMPVCHVAAADAMKTPAEVFAPHAGAVFRMWRIEGARAFSPIAEKWLADMARPEDSYRRFRALVLERWGEKCHYCEATGIALQLDHVMPRSRGGPDHPDNLVPACGPCNSSKGARTPEEWRAR